MLLKISWRNIWRNKRRSLIVLSSVIIGVIAAILLDGLTMGMLNQMLSNQINSSISHMQIHKKGFNDNKTVQNYLPDYRKTEEVVKNNPSVKHYSKRVITFGLLSSAANSSGVYINGIVPDEEKNITYIKSSIIEGNYITGDGREIVIGKNLAEKLDVGLGDKVVAMSNTPSGSVGSDVFRIAGIYETFSSEFDRINIYIPLSRAQQMLDIGDNIHEIAVITNDYNRVTAVKEEITKNLNSDYEILSYIDLLPLLVVMLDMYKEMTWIINLIVGLALIFGIINVMLMAVFERIREFGVLISIGMKTSKLFMMIVIESFIIGIMGTGLGITLGLIIQAPLSKIGINLSIFAESLKSYGVGAVIYPAASMDNLISLLIMIPFVSVIAALYPAYKAIKLEPVSAIRYV
jgi:ABC-type lipoprotein release transport system permease subunit